MRWREHVRRQPKWVVAVLAVLGAIEYTTGGATEWIEIVWLVIQYLILITVVIVFLLVLYAKWDRGHRKRVAKARERRARARRDY